jgi:hypothetical protein
LGFVGLNSNQQKGTEQMTKANFKIWSRRYNPAKGNHWQLERDSTEENAQAWLKIFRDDEPGVLFLASVRKPAN